MEERDGSEKNPIKIQRLLKSYKSLRNKMANTFEFSIRLQFKSLINENKDNPKNMRRVIDKMLEKASNTIAIQVSDGSKQFLN